MCNYHTVTTILANLGTVGCKSNYHTDTTTLANIGSVVCKCNYHTVKTTLANLVTFGYLQPTAPRLARVVMTVW
jgi:hypothetical protein